MEKYSDLFYKSRIYHGVSTNAAAFLSTTSSRRLCFSTVSGKYPDFIHVQAGGSLTFETPCSFEQLPLPSYILILVESGTGLVTLGNISISLAKDSLLLISPESPVRFQVTEAPVACSIYHLCGTPLDRYAEELFSGGLLYHTVQEIPALIKSPLASATGFIEHEDSYSIFYLSSLFHRLFTYLLQPKQDQIPGRKKLSPETARMKSIFETRYMENISLELMAQELNMDYYRLCRIFSREIGTSPIHYLNGVRIEKSMLLLTSTNYTIHEIGSLVGIDNTTHYINLFKKNTGITPLQFRQQYQSTVPIV